MRSSLLPAQPRRLFAAMLAALALAGGLTATADARWKQDPDSCYVPPETIQGGIAPCEP